MENNQFEIRPLTKKHKPQTDAGTLNVFFPAKLLILCSNLFQNMLNDFVVVSESFFVFQCLCNLLFNKRVCYGTANSVRWFTGRHNVYLIVSNV